MYQRIAQTERLVIRTWQSDDKEPFAEMNRSPAVMEYLGPPLSRSKSDELVDRYISEQERRGFCPWVVELLDSNEFVGFVGLHAVPDYLPFAPGVEVGWRLNQRFWGMGLATEAARAALLTGFDTLKLDEIVSMTAVLNVRSQRVMERLGMSRNVDDDFEHSGVDVGSPLRAHVLYRLAAVRYNEGVRQRYQRL